MLTDYRFNTNRNQRIFCKIGGDRPFGVGNDTPIGKMHGVNIGCLEGQTEEALPKIPISYVDGMHEGWTETPRYFAHL